MSNLGRSCPAWPQEKEAEAVWCPGCSTFREPPGFVPTPAPPGSGVGRGGQREAQADPACFSPSGMRNWPRSFPKLWETELQRAVLGGEPGGACSFLCRAAVRPG